MSAARTHARPKPEVPTSRFFDLPVEVRAMIYKYLYAHSLEEKRLEARPDPRIKPLSKQTMTNEDNAADLASVLGLVRDKLWTEKLSENMKRKFRHGRRRHCAQCSRRFDELSYWERCWNCAESARGLLYVNRQIWNESIAIFYELTTPVILGPYQLWAYAYCVRSYGHGSLVRQIKLRISSSEEGWRILQWRNRTKPCRGALGQVFQNLDSVRIQFESVNCERRESAQDIYNPRGVEKTTRYFVEALAGFKDLKVEVTGLWNFRTKAFIESSVSKGQMGKYNFQRASEDP